MRSSPPPDPVAAFARLDTRRKRLVVFVAFYRRRYGTGPTWRTAAAAVGVRKPQARWPLVMSVRPCLSWDLEVSGSLDVAPELAPILAPVIDRATSERSGP